MSGFDGENACKSDAGVVCPGFLGQHDNKKKHSSKWSQLPNAFFVANVANVNGT
jgi:hypothetical protein